MKGRRNSSEKVLKPQYYWCDSSCTTLGRVCTLKYHLQSLYTFSIWSWESMEGMQKAYKLYANFSLRVVVAPYPCIIIQGSTVPFSCTALGLPGIQRLGQKLQDSSFKKSEWLQSEDLCILALTVSPRTGSSLLDDPKVL